MSTLSQSSKSNATSNTTSTTEVLNQPIAIINQVAQMVSHSLDEVASSQILSELDTVKHYIELANVPLSILATSSTNEFLRQLNDPDYQQSLRNQVDLLRNENDESGFSNVIANATENLVTLAERRTNYTQRYVDEVRNTSTPDNRHDVSIPTGKSKSVANNVAEAVMTQVNDDSLNLAAKISNQVSDHTEHRSFALYKSSAKSANSTANKKAKNGEDEKQRDKVNLTQLPNSDGAFFLFPCDLPTLIDKDSPIPEFGPQQGYEVLIGLNSSETGYTVCPYLHKNFVDGTRLVSFQGDLSNTAVISMVRQYFSGNGSIRYIQSDEPFGFKVGVSTVMDNIKSFTNTVLYPMAEVLSNYCIIYSPVIGCDETACKSQKTSSHSHKKTKVASYVAVKSSEALSPVKCAIFKAMPNRTGRSIKEAIGLENFTINLRSIITDAYSTYETISTGLAENLVNDSTGDQQNISHQICWAHIYRYVLKALKPFLDKAEKSFIRHQKAEITLQKLNSEVSKLYQKQSASIKGLLDIAYYIHVLFKVERESYIEALLTILDTQDELDLSKVRKLIETPYERNKFLSQPENQQVLKEVIASQREQYSSDLIDLIYKKIAIVDDYQSKHSCTEDEIKAIAYIKNRGDAPKVFLTDPTIPIHNNLCEGAFKSLLLFRNRNNHCLSDFDSIKRLCSFATVYETLAMNGLEDYFEEFMKYLHSAMFDHSLCRVASICVAASPNLKRDPETGAIDLSNHIKQFNLSTTQGSFDFLGKYVKFLESKGVYLPLEITDYECRCSALRAQIAKADELRTYCKQRNLNKKWEELEQTHPDVLAAEQAKIELEQLLQNPPASCVRYASLMTPCQDASENTAKDGKATKPSGRKATSKTSKTSKTSNSRNQTTTTSKKRRRPPKDTIVLPLDRVNSVLGGHSTSAQVTITGT